jgi:hypothetical protein
MNDLKRTLGESLALRQVNHIYQRKPRSLAESPKAIAHFDARGRVEEVVRVARVSYLFAQLSLTCWRINEAESFWCVRVDPLLGL